MIRSVLLWPFLAASITFAQGSEPEAPPLTLSRAAELVLQNNPRLRSAQFARAAAETRVTEAAFKPQWSVALEVEDILGTGAVSALDASESTLRLSRIFQPAERRQGRIAVASALGQGVDNRLEAERLDLLSLLAQRYVDVVYRQQQLRLARQSVEVWETSSELALARERAGAAPAVDRLRSEIRLTHARLSRDSAEHRLEAARRLLASTWGDSTADFGAASASLCRLQELAPYEQLAARIEQNPDLLRFATERRLREAESRLAAARQRPDWTLSAGVRHLGASGDQAVVFSVSVPLGAKPRAEPGIRRAEALGRQSVLQKEAREIESRATLFRLYQEVLHTIRKVEVFDTGILPKVRSIRDEIEAGYSVGRFSYTALVSAQAELLAAASARLDACADHHRFLIDIERLIGGEPVSLDATGGVSP